MNIGSKIKILREKKGISREELSNLVKITSQSLFNYETGKRQVPIDTLRGIAAFFNVPIEYFFYDNFQLSKKELSTKGETRQIPILESVSAGNGNSIDIYKEDNIKDWIDISISIAKKADFGTFIEGDSMEPRFHDGDLILVERTDTLNFGEIGVFTLNEQVYCKKYEFNQFLETVTLKSLNSDYAPIKVTKNDDFKIEGRVITCIAYNI